MGERTFTPIRDYLGGISLIKIQESNVGSQSPTLSRGMAYPPAEVNLDQLAASLDDKAAHEASARRRRSGETPPPAGLPLGATTSTPVFGKAGACG